MGNAVIYRPVYDAEVEYLESTGTQYIDTGITLSNYDGFEIRYSPTQTSTFIGNSEVIGSRNPEDSAVVLGFNANDSITRNIGCRVYIRWGTLAISADSSSIASVDEWYTASVNVSNRIASDGLGNSVTLDDIPQSTSNLFLFAGRQSSTGIVYANVKIAYCKFYSNSILIRDFIPVRIGSVGYMYDKVTKQLFANKGTGNFILGNDVSNAVIPQQRCVLYFGSQRCVGFERIYEEYEWLKGDGSAYIDTSVTSFSGVICIKFKKSAINETRLFGRERRNTSIADYSERCVLQYSINGGCVNIYGVNNVRLYSDIENEVLIDITNDIAYGIDGATASGFSITPNLDALSLYLFADHRKDGATDISSDYISKFSITNSINLTPCRLLRPIPAILDGNGIARQAGECGMWDKVSNKFYGNVANSGTFTVKGPKCYEEYKWLVAEIPPQSVLMTIGVGDVFNYSRVYESIGNSSHLLTDGYNYYTSSHAMVSIGVWNGSKNVENKAVNFTNGLDVVCTQDKLTFNSVEFSKYGFPASLRWNNSARAEGANTVVKTSSITVDGSVRYVPCKLIHGIPASMDANGISRPAGTCGMWDKVNDKFYGNVANSGTFTVSND